MPLFSAVGVHPELLRSVYILMTLCLLGCFVWPRKGVLWLFLTFCWLTLVILDQLWIQGLAFYGTIYVLLVFNERDLNSLKGNQVLLATLVGINAAFYFWTGIAKLNFGFLYSLMPWLVSPFVQIESRLVSSILGLGISFSEILAGILLLFPRTRRGVANTLIAFHLFVFVIFGPFGLNYHMAILPLSFVQILILLVIRSTSYIGFWDALSPKTYWGGGVRMLYFFFPLLSTVGLWDDLLSFRLYSNSVLISHIYVTKEDTWQQGAVFASMRNRGKVSIPQWSIKQTGYVYLNRNYYRGVFQSVCSRSSNPQRLCLSIDHSERKTLFFLSLEEPNEYWDCIGQPRKNCEWVSGP